MNHDLKILISLVQKYSIDANRELFRKSKPTHLLFICFPKAGSGQTGAYYKRLKTGYSRIDIYRTVEPQFILEPVRLAEKSQDPLNELIYLAHELGHHVDFLKTDIVPIFDETAPETSLEAEETAWDLAEKLLREHCFKNWDEFHKTRIVRLKEYEIGLRLE